MRLFFYVSCVIGISQIVLAGLYFFVPVAFVSWQGLTPPPSDIGYPLAMLAARFLVYGIGMFWIARNPNEHLLWARGMVLIQLLDFAAGAVYVALGLVNVADAALPMVNAVIFAGALSLTLNLALNEKRAVAV